MSSVGSREIPSCEITISLRYYLGEMLDDHAEHQPGKDSILMFKLVHAGGRRSIWASSIDLSFALQILPRLLGKPFEVFIRVHWNVVSFHEMLSERFESLPIKDEQISYRMDFNCEYYYFL